MPRLLPEVALTIDDAREPAVLEGRVTLPRVSNVADLLPLLHRLDRSPNRVSRPSFLAQEAVLSSRSELPAVIHRQLEARGMAVGLDLDHTSAELAPPAPPAGNVLVGGDQFIPRLQTVDLYPAQISGENPCARVQAEPDLASLQHDRPHRLACRTLRLDLLVGGELPFVEDERNPLPLLVDDLADLAPP